MNEIIIITRISTPVLQPRQKRKGRHSSSLLNRPVLVPDLQRIAGYASIEKAEWSLLLIIILLKIINFFQLYYFFIILLLIFNFLLVIIASLLLLLYYSLYPTTSLLIFTASFYPLPCYYSAPSYKFLYYSATCYSLLLLPST